PLPEWVRTFLVVRRQDVETACYASPELIVRLARSSEAEFASGQDRFHWVSCPKQDTGWRYPCNALWRTQVVELGRSPADARRQVTRILLKTAGIPDRVVAAANGFRLEVRDHGAWVPVDLDWPATTT